MRICFVDDSVAFDGQTPLTVPLGGAERAVVGLATALAARGHDVTVFNRCSEKATVGGVTWSPLDGEVPEMTDIVIACRKPRLLKHVPMAFRRVLWVMGRPDYLEKPAVADLLERFGVRLMFIGRTQAASYRGKRPGLTVPPGVADAFLAPPSGAPAASSGPPVAVVTTHPDNGLRWLVDLWTDSIHPQAPDAKLHVYSNLLARAAKGESVSDDVAHLWDSVSVAEDKGVSVLEPLSESGMAAAYAAARCHLYPGHADDMACWTLIDSQGAGLPAVARTRGAAHERLSNGETGYLVPDDAAFANVAAQMLTDTGMADGLARAAAQPSRRRPWSVVAAEVEALWAVDTSADTDDDGTAPEAGARSGTTGGAAEVDG